jgi:hypothetical protein
MLMWKGVVWDILLDLLNSNCFIDIGLDCEVCDIV